MNDYTFLFIPDMDTTFVITGWFMAALTVYGIVLTYKIKRPPIFKFKVMMIYIIPAILTFSYLLPIPITSRPYRILLICTYIALLNVLYWREVRSLTSHIGYKKKMLPEFLDLSPDLIWIKDLKNRFVYTNESIRNTLLMCSEVEAYGKTGTELAEVQKNKGHEYTFGAICDQSDNETMIRLRPSRFMEIGTVNGKFLALQVYKAPVYDTAPDGSKVLSGTIGIGRDLTYDFVDHQVIEDFMNAGEIDKAVERFKIHKNRYMFTGVDLIRKRDDRRWGERRSGNENSD